MTSPTQFDDVPKAPMKAMARLRGRQALRSMRTAIYLLLLWVALTLIPTFIPQNITNSEKVQEIARTQPFWFNAANKLRLFDVFTAPWYMAVWISLLIVLILCLLPRTRAFVRQWRRAIATPREGALPRLPHEVSWRTDMAPQEAARSLRSVLRRKRFRNGRPNGRGQWVAEKGVGREAGSLLFHWSIFVIAMGLLVSRAFGFTGFAVITEGQRWTEAPMDIDRYRAPYLMQDAVHRHFVVQLDAAGVLQRKDGSPDFFADVSVLDGARTTRRDIRVNSPLNYRGVKMYLGDIRWATRVVVRDPATSATVFDDYVQLDPGGPRGSWTGVVKIPGTRPQTGLEVYFLPTAVQVTGAEAAGMHDALGPGVLVASAGGPVASNPAILFKEFRGNLGLDRPQQVNALDKASIGDAVDIGIAPLGGQTFQLRDGVSVSFPDKRHYVVFQVKRDPGLVVVFAGAAMVFAGLVPSLYVFRRRLWAWVDVSDAGGSVITLGGLAYQRKDAFPDEFTDLVGAVRERVPAAGAGERSPVDPEQREPTRSTT